MQYKIQSITRDGSPRTDGEYPKRVGCVGGIVQAGRGLPMIFSYSKDADGNDKIGFLVTSMVTNVKHEADNIVVTTLNSVYTLVVA